MQLACSILSRSDSCQGDGRQRHLMMHGQCPIPVYSSQVFATLSGELVFFFLKSSVYLLYLYLHVDHRQITDVTQQPGRVPETSTIYRRRDLPKTFHLSPEMRPHSERWTSLSCWYARFAGLSCCSRDPIG